MNKLLPVKDSPKRKQKLGRESSNNSRMPRRTTKKMFRMRKERRPPRSRSSRMKLNKKLLKMPRILQLQG